MVGSPPPSGFPSRAARTNLKEESTKRVTPRRPSSETDATSSAGRFTTAPTRRGNPASKENCRALTGAAAAS